MRGCSVSARGGDQGWGEEVTGVEHYVVWTLDPEQLGIVKVSSFLHCFVVNHKILLCSHNLRIKR